MLGIAYLVYLYTKHPERVQETGRVFLEEPEPPEAPPLAPVPARV